MLLCTAILYTLAALPLTLPLPVTFLWVMVAAFITSMMQFSLYPLIVAMANDSVAPERRVSLTACLLMAYGVGACIGPLVTGAIMQPLGEYAVCLLRLCGVVIAGISWFANRIPQIVTEAPIPHVPLPDSLTSSPLVAALNPTLTEEDIQAAMIDTDEDVTENDDGEDEDGPAPLH
ncbi:MFS transporter [Erwinia sp. E_sp_B01_9]|uniref:MFS transporter n=1 Tax=Erwinia sp. E_sp_B01_9 TaxID=3039403 RepID=UPI003D9B5F1C